MKPAPKKPPQPPSPKKPKAAKPAKAAAAAAPRVVYKEAPRGRGGGPTISGPTVTVTPQTTVTSGAAGNAALSAKIDELLRESRAKKSKSRQNTVFAQAKKQYRQLRKNSFAKLKAENKQIRKREAAKIQKLPVKQRSQARKRLKEALKKREAQLKAKLPSQIQTPGHLRSLLTAFRTLKV